MAGELISAGAGLAGAVIGGAATLLTTLITSRRAERDLVAREEREEGRQRAAQLRSAQVAAATAVLGVFGEMNDIWQSADDIDFAANDHGRHLWRLHEAARTASLILPERHRESVIESASTLRFADEIGGSGDEQGDFIFLGPKRVAEVAYEAISEELTRFIAGDEPRPWSADALRVRAARQPWLVWREGEYALEGFEYESERAEFDGRHAGLTEQIEHSRSVRRDPA